MHHDGGAAGPLLLGRLLHLPHQVQEWGRAVWGLLVGPGREPVMLQASLFRPALSRRQRPTQIHVNALSPETSPEMQMAGEKETQEGGHRERDLDLCHLHRTAQGHRSEVRSQLGSRDW